MAPLGHSGSQTSQLMQSSVMIRDMEQLLSKRWLRHFADNDAANCAGLPTGAPCGLVAHHETAAVIRCAWRTCDAPASVLVEAFVQGVGDCRVDEIGDIAAQRRDFPHQG